MPTDENVDWINAHMLSNVPTGKLLTGNANWENADRRNECENTDCGNMPIGENANWRECRLEEVPIKGTSD